MVEDGSRLYRPYGSKFWPINTLQAQQFPVKFGSLVVYSENMGQVAI